MSIPSKPLLANDTQLRTNLDLIDGFEAIAENDAVPAFQPPIDAISFTDGFLAFKARKFEASAVFFFLKNGENRKDNSEN